MDSAFSKGSALILKRDEANLMQTFVYRGAAPRMKARKWLYPAPESAYPAYSFGESPKYFNTNDSACIAQRS